MFADDDVQWSSRFANATEMPTGWCAVNDDCIKLKDVAHGFYKNALLKNNTFRYEFPPQPRPGRDTEVKVRLMTDATISAPERTVVRLYRVAHGHDNYLGEWKVCKAGVDTRPYVHLQRLVKQTDARQQALKKRSRSEGKHQEVLECFFEPWGMRIEFEPDCASGLRVPCVQDGKLDEWSSDLYTVDYVAYNVRSCRAVFIESKCCVEDLNDVAKKKCRRLRDTGLRRVIAIVDHGAREMFYDFGTGDDDEGWYVRDALWKRLESHMCPTGTGSH